MKNVLKNCCLLLFLLTTVNVYSQIQRTHFGLGIGPSQDYYTLFDEKRMIALSLSKVSSGLVQKIADNDEIDFILLGWYLNTGIHRTKDEYIDETFYDYDISLGTGLKVELNLFGMLEKITNNSLDLEGLEVFVGLQTGAEYIAHVWEDSDYFDDFRYKVNPYVGARYFLNERFGFFLEAGRTNFGIANIGLSFGKSN